MQRKPIIILIAALAMIAVGVLAFSNDSSPEPEPAQTGDKQKSGPEFTLTDLDGKQVSLKDYRGKVVLVNFWATWCPPCIKEIPDLVKLRNNYEDKGFEILGLVVEKQNVEPKVRKMVRDFEISYPVLWSSQKAIDEFGPIRAIPRTFIINQDGKIVEDVEGMGNYEMFESLVKKYIKES